MDLDKDIERLTHINQKLTKVIKRGKDLESAKSSSIIEECKSLRDKLEQAASNFVDTNDLSDLDKVINVLHNTGAILAQVDENLKNKSSIQVNGDDSDNDEDAFSRIQFSNARPNMANSDSDTSEVIRAKSDKPARKSFKTSSSNSSFVGTMESTDNIPEDPFTFKADFSQLSIENEPSHESSFVESNTKTIGNDKVSMEMALKEAIETINDYKAYVSTLEELIRDLALGDLHLNSNDKARFLEVNRDSKAFIDNLGSALGVTINRPNSMPRLNTEILPQLEYSPYTDGPVVGGPSPVFYLRRMNLTSKIYFIDPILLSNYFGQYLYKPSFELLRFGNLFTISLSGGFTDLNYSYKVSVKCLTQSMDIFMSILPSENRSVCQYMSKNSTAELRENLNLANGPFPILSLSIVQSDGFACKFNITLPLGPFLTMTSNFLSTREFDALWRSPVYTNSKFSAYELSILCFESKDPLPMIDVLIDDIKGALALNGLINVAQVGPVSQIATFQLSCTLAVGFLSLFNIDKRLFRDCSNTCLMGKVTLKFGRNKLNIKLELKSIVQILLISTKDCIKESLSTVLNKITHSTISTQYIKMDKDVTFPLPFEPPVNEIVDFTTNF